MSTSDALGFAGGTGGQTFRVLHLERLDRGLELKRKQTPQTQTRVDSSA
ncbi:MAG: hypothetical protein U0165_03675 [Polyangiaceae bacterium]